MNRLIKHTALALTLGILITSVYSVFSPRVIAQTFTCDNNFWGACITKEEHCDEGSGYYPIISSGFFTGKRCEEVDGIACPAKIETPCLYSPPPCTSPNQCHSNSCASGYTPAVGDCPITDDVCCAPTGGGDDGGGDGGSGDWGGEGVVVNINSLITGIGGKIPSLSNLGAILSAALPILYAIAGFTLFLFLISSGFKYLTSAGDPKKLEAAKSAITTAIVGFIIIFMAYWLTEIANYIFKLGVAF